MTSYYKCVRCEKYISDKRSNILNHLNKKNKCEKSHSALNFNDKEIYEKSLIRILGNNDNNSEIESENIECTFCNKNFSTKYYLKKHVEKCKNNKNFNISNYNTQINNISINVNITNPIPFDNDWDVSNIDLLTKKNLLMSKIMYSNLLSEILNNELNLNVIIEKESDTGLVYKNDKDTYIKMKIKDIIDKTMEKLKNHLLNFIDDANSDKLIIDTYLKEFESNIVDKYQKYIENNEINTFVQNYMIKLYEDKKNDAIDVMNKINTINIDSIKKLDGF